MRITAFVVFATCLSGPMHCDSNRDSNSDPIREMTSVSVETQIDFTEPNDPLIPPIVLEPGSIGSKIPLDFSHDIRATFEPHGNQVCASGCAASSHPTGELLDFEFDELKNQYALGPMDQTNRALETLLYYGPQTRAMLESHGSFPLDFKRLDFLQHELAKTHAFISFRIVDENGIVRTYMPPTRIPLDRRHVFEMETHNLPGLVTSGTVKRVGLHHLWTRL